MPADCSAPPTEFNFAGHLLAINAGRAAKTAYIDDRGQLTYGELDEKARRAASALLGLGIRPEDRVLLLMNDCTDWPVTFLGALYAGVVPVAVNTLLTPADYGYMLEHSRARAVLVSRALLPKLSAALGACRHGVRHIVVSRDGSDAEVGGTLDFDDWLTGHEPLAAPPPRWPTSPRSGCIRPDPPASPRARCTRMATHTGRRSCMPSPCWACARMTSCSRPPSCSSPTAWATP